jgi:hypothetical protein
LAVVLLLFVIVLEMTPPRLRGTTVAIVGIKFVVMFALAWLSGVVVRDAMRMAAVCHSAASSGSCCLRRHSGRVTAAGTVGPG